MKTVTRMLMVIVFLWIPLQASATAWTGQKAGIHNYTDSPAKLRAMLFKLEEPNPLSFSAHINPGLLNKLQNTGALLTESIDERWENEAWLQESRDLYSYVNDAMSEDLTQRWTGSSWADTVKMNYTWNGNSDMVEMVSQEWVNQAWQNSFKSMMSYDGHHNQTQNTTQSWQEQAWVNNNNTLYEYDANQNNTRHVMQNWDVDSSVWIDFMQTLNTFDAANLKTESLSQMWMTAFWWDMSKDFYTYDAQNNLIEEISQSWDGMSWTNSGRNTYAYDANGNETEWIGQVWNEAWVNTNRWLSSYSGDQLTEIIMQMWDGAAWMNTERYATSYNNDGQMEEMLIQSWVNSAWVNESRTTYNYGPVGIEDTPGAVPTHTRLLQNYPNPFNPLTVIPVQLDQAGEIEIAVYSVLGEKLELLWSGYRAAGSFELKWNAIAYPSGVYFYILKSEQGLQLTRKMLLVR